MNVVDLLAASSLLSSLTGSHWHSGNCRLSDLRASVSIHDGNHVLVFSMLLSDLLPRKPGPCEFFMLLSTVQRYWRLASFMLNQRRIPLEKIQHPQPGWAPPPHSVQLRGIPPYPAQKTKPTFANGPFLLICENQGGGYCTVPYATLTDRPSVSIHKHARLLCTPVLVTLPLTLVDHEYNQSWSDSPT